MLYAKPPLASPGSATGGIPEIGDSCDATDYDAEVA